MFDKIMRVTFFIFMAAVIMMVTAKAILWAVSMSSALTNVHMRLSAVEQMVLPTKGPQEHK